MMHLITTDQMHQDAYWRLRLYSTCLHHASKWEYIGLRVVESDFGLQADAGTPNIAIHNCSLRASTKSIP